VECASSAGTPVLLDGSSSNDPDSRPGTNDDIVLFRWFADFGLPTQTLLASGSTVTAILPLGSNRITLQVIDAEGNESTSTVVISVLDRTPPAVSCPAPRVLECDSPQGAFARVLADAADSCGSTVILTNTQTTIADASGVYPLGTTQVTFTAADASGNTASCSVPVSVQDTTPPVLSCPQFETAECTSPAGTSIHIAATATDLCSPTAVQILNDRSLGGADASGTYPLGATPVTFTATDASGNVATCGTNLTVQDITSPQLALALSPKHLWPPNHRIVPVHAAWQVTDACDPAAGVLLASAASTEPDDASGTGDGNTMGDIQDSSVGTPDDSVLLRAERSGDGPGRVYTLTYVARDASGNAASALGIVAVPHDEEMGPEPVMVSLEGDGTPVMAHLYWNEVSGAQSYDVIQGDLAEVSESNGEIRLGPVHVLASGQTGASYSEGPSRATPAMGRVFFYLVQYREGQTVSGWGTESSPWPAEPSSCDIGCPGEPVVSSVPR